MCNALLHKSARFPFLSICIKSGHFKASVHLMPAQCSSKIQSFKILHLVYHAFYTECSPPYARALTYYTLFTTPFILNVQGWPEPYIYGVYTVYLAGKSPYIRSYTVYIYGSSQPYKCSPPYTGASRYNNCSCLPSLNILQTCSYCYTTIYSPPFSAPVYCNALPILHQGTPHLLVPQLLKFCVNTQ